MDELLEKLRFRFPTCRYQSSQTLQPQIVRPNRNLEQKPEEWESIDPLNLFVGDVIARGAFGVVHKGSYRGQTVAVKVLTFGAKGITLELLTEVLLQEVHVWKNLDHPNIIKMIGVTKCMPKCSRKSKESKFESSCCMVAEYAKGGTLRSYLKKNRIKKLPFKIVIRLALDIAKGLSYLHSKKIIHRDVKPENMLLDKQHTVKLADFGVSIFEPSDFPWLRGEVGTRGYMAPEVLGGKFYGHKSDVYSFGICLWEIYCCETSYSYLGTLDNITADIYKDMRPNTPATCPRSLARLMERCWDVDQKKRPEMKDVVLELQEMVKSEMCQTSSLDPPRPGCFYFFNHGR